MEKVNIEVRDHGPYLVSGEVQIRDGEGNLVKTSEKCYLCRCGLSTNAPFCTGAHKGQFMNEVRAK
jgi:CDGSH iron-sulfur domain-containing protein 3